MQVTKEPIEPCQVALTIEVEQDKVVQAVDRAYREYSKYVSIPGFRKGKAPMNFVRQRVPESDVRQRTAELLVEPAYAEAIKQEEVQPYAQPKLELLQLELAEKPFIFKAIVPLAPVVELGQYTGIEVDKNKYLLTDEDIDEQISRMRDRAADYPQVERPSQTGDLLIADVAAIVDARPEAAEARKTMIEIGAEGNLPGFDENMTGLSTGDTKTFNVSYPEDYYEEDVAGQEAEFTVTVHEIRAKELPPMGDELAQKISNGKIETLDALKENLRTDMERNLANNSERQVENQIIEKIVDLSTLKYPEVLVDSEVDLDAKDLLSRLEQQKISLEQYLEQTQQTTEQLRESLRQEAEKKIRVGLALGEIATKENLAVTPEDIEAYIAEQADTQRVQPAAFRAMLEANNAMDSLINRAQTKKVLDFLRASAIINEKEVHPSLDSSDEINEAAEEAEEDVLEDTILTESSAQ